MSLGSWPSFFDLRTQQEFPQLVSKYIHSFVLHPSTQWLSVFFRTLAIIVAAPIAFFTALDVAAYLIARTVGASHHRDKYHRRPRQSTIRIPAIKAASPEDLIQTQIVINTITQLPTPPNESSPSSDDSKHRDYFPLKESSRPIHFASGSEVNFQLSGEGTMFSPPSSRSASPSRGRRRHRRVPSVGVDALGTITDSGGDEEESSSSNGSSMGEVIHATTINDRLAVPSSTSHMRKRNPGLQFTPMGL